MYELFLVIWFGARRDEVMTKTFYDANRACDFMAQGRKDKRLIRAVAAPQVPSYERINDNAYMVSPSVASREIVCRKVTPDPVAQAPYWIAVEK